jgi:hypothetical protein
VNRDKLLTVLVLPVIIASIVAFVWWRSKKTLMDTEHPDAMASIVATDR